MKKLIIGGLVGGIILFIWQFLSFGVFDLHYSQMAYTPLQDQIMECLEETDLSQGEYYIIRAPKGDAASQETLMEERLGKPWAMIQYHDALEHNFGMNVIRAVVINFAAIFILAWVLLQFKDTSMKNALLLCVGVGLTSYFTSSYMDTIWYQTNSLPDLVDAIVPWSIIGAWLGWWTNR